MYTLTEDVVSVSNRSFHFQADGWCQVNKIFSNEIYVKVAQQTHA
jgi:hypothetical protein